MPHQCTNCGRTFPDGSKEMLSGCPECGGKKFQFDPASREAAEESGVSERRQGGDASETRDPSPRETRGRETSPEPDDPLDRSWPGESAESEKPEEPEEPTGFDYGQTVDAETDEGVTPADDAARGATRGEPPEEQSPTDETPRERSPSDATPHERTTPDDQPTVEEYATRDEGVSEADADAGPESDPDTTTDRPGARSGTDPHADVETETDEEDAAQADARSEVVSGSELPQYGSADPSVDPEAASTTTASERTERGTPEDHTERGTSEDGPEHADTRSTGAEETADPDAIAQDPSYERLREELNEQFESIRIVRPGEYELNLMELYDREEFIISLREDGRYVIEMPDAWDSPDE
ncbi:Zn-ribbon containing protein [Halobaculum sp. MBLA0147]|uniref:OapC/ArvC family zinc-ribbon domain-containing protein n=1 Tax=Halobaculum sp. MBLA0147 TaxID=3079934 RepID=UPI0035235DCD